MARKLTFASFVVLCVAMVALIGVQIFAITQSVFEGNMTLSYSPIEVGDIVSYGEYPQTYVGSSLNTTLSNELSAGRLTATGKTYSAHLYQTLNNYTEYIYNGAKYVYVPTAKFWDGADDGGGYSDNAKFSTGDTASASVNQGISCFFKVEPINFRVMAVNLANYEITVEAVQVLGSTSFNRNGTNDWASSNMRNYLNSSFLNCSGLAPIAKSVTNLNNVTSNYTSTAGTQSTDSIWLPSILDLRSWYGSSTLTVGSTLSSLRKKLSDFAIATYTRDFQGTGYSYYGLRTAGNASGAVCWVSQSATTKINANFTINGSDLGFAPALVVNLA